jgi:hypothetical protein
MKYRRTQNKRNTVPAGAGVSTPKRRTTTKGKTTTALAAKLTTSLEEEMSKEKPKMKGLVRGLIHDRCRDFLANSRINITHAWTLSTVWYTIEPILKQLDMKIKDRTREIVQDRYVLEICRDELRITRESIGIYAAHKGVLFYRGQQYIVTPDNLHELAKFGTDLIVIEKEAPAKAFSHLAEKYPISILSTGGFLSEKHEQLATLVNERKGHISIWHDLDDAGIKIGMQVKGIFDLGLDFEALEELGVNEQDVRQEQKAKKSTHMVWLRKYCPTDHSMSRHLHWLEVWKIEIDTVMKVVSAERIWKELILKRLAEQFPSRDYTDVVNVKGTWTEPHFVKELNDEMQNACKDMAQGIDEELMEELGDVKDEIPSIDDIDKDMGDRRLDAYEAHEKYEELKEKYQELKTWIAEQDWRRPSSSS